MKEFLLSMMIILLHQFKFTSILLEFLLKFYNYLISFKKKKKMKIKKAKNTFILILF